MSFAEVIRAFVRFASGVVPSFAAEFLPYFPIKLGKAPLNLWHINSTLLNLYYYISTKFFIFKTRCTSYEEMFHYTIPSKIEITNI